jgi:hypothetical protein
MRLLAFFRLDKPSMLFAFGSIVAGGIGLLTTNQLQPAAEGGPLIWAVYWLVIVGSVALVVHGLLSILILLYRSGRLAWAYTHLVRFQSPVYLVLPGSPERPPAPNGVGATGSLTVIPGAPRQGLTIDEALRGWESDRTRLRKALDTALTWLYRRQNWLGLSHDGRFSEPAPADIWGSKKYHELGLDPLPYEPPTQVPVEPGWQPPAENYEVVPTEPPAPAPAHGQNPTERRPPTAQTLPAESWVHARPDFCRRLNGIAHAGRTLVAELRAIPITAPEEGKWRQQTAHYNTVLDKFGEDYFGQTVSSMTLPKGEASLGPPWRAKLVRLVSMRVAWLEAQIVEFGCAPTENG